MYYYGARYYDARTSIFISTDPLMDKYPGWSPFVYAFNNPIRYSDPTGMEGDDETTPYKVQKGNTLGQIANDNNTTVDALMKANPQIKDKNNIQAGQTMNIPGQSSNTLKNSPAVGAPFPQSDNNSTSESSPCSYCPSNSGNSGAKEADKSRVGVVIYGAEKASHREEFSQRKDAKHITVMDIADISNDFSDYWPWKKEKYKVRPDEITEYYDARPNNRGESYDSIAVDPDGDTTGYIFPREFQPNGASKIIKK